MVFLSSNKLKANVNAVASVDQLHQASRACPVNVDVRSVFSLRNKLILAAVSTFTEGDGEECVEVGSPALLVRNLCICMCVCVCVCVCIYIYIYIYTYI